MADSSILTSVKKTLGVEEDDTSFDPEIVLYINSVFSTLNQIGIGPVHGFEIEDQSATWDEFLAGDPRYNSVKAFMSLKVRMLFDPPPTSFAIAAMESQIKEYEVRIYTESEADKCL